MAVAGIYMVKCCNFKKIIKKPEKLYHMTSLPNYNSMLKDGVIKKSNEIMGDGVGGVFLSDMDSLRNKYPQNVIKRMLNYYGKNSEGRVVVLEFDASDLGNSKLMWRQTQLPEYGSLNIPKEWNSFNDFCSEKLKPLHKKPLEFIYTDTVPVSKIKSVIFIDIPEFGKNISIKSFWEKFSDKL